MQTQEKLPIQFRMNMNSNTETTVYCSGLIKTTKPLDYETTTQYNLTVHVTDGKHVSGCT